MRPLPTTRAGRPASRLTRVLVPAGVGAAAVAAVAIVLTVRSGGTAPPTAPPSPPETLISRPVGPARTVPLSPRGAAVVRVSAEVPAAGGAGTLAAVPVGAPVTIDVDLRGAMPADGARPVAALERVIRQDGRLRPVEAVPLDGGVTLLVAPRTGLVTASDMSAVHGHGSGEALWTASLGAAATALAVDPLGRSVAASHTSAGRIDTVDLVTHRARAALVTGGRPSGVWFDPRGRLWTADAGSGAVSVWDVRTRRRVGTVTAGPAPAQVAFATGPRPTALVVASDGAARVVDLATLRTRGAVRAGAGASGAAWAPGAGGYVVATGAGGLTLVPVAPGGRPGGARVVHRGPGEAAAAMAVAPDGRTAVTVSAGARLMSLVDLTGARPTATVPTGTDPAQVAFLEGFAVVRNAGSPDLTWVDIAAPATTATLPIPGGRPATGMAAAATGGDVMVAVPAAGELHRLQVILGRPMLTERYPLAPAAQQVLTAPGGLLPTATPGTYRVQTMLSVQGTWLLRLEAGATSGVTALRALPAGGAARRQIDPAAVRARVGRPAAVRFFLTGAAPAAAEVLVEPPAPGPRRRVPAGRVSPAEYVATFTPRTPGTYLLSLRDRVTGAPAAASGVRVRVTP